MFKRITIAGIIVTLNIVLLLYTAIEKVTDYAVLKEQLAILPLLAPVAKPIAWLLPWIELAIAVLLVIPRWRLRGLYCSLVLVIVFTGYLIAIGNLNQEIACSCGGVIELLSWKEHLLFNSVLILLDAWGIALIKRQKIAFVRVWHEGSSHSTFRERI